MSTRMRRNGMFVLFLAGLARGPGLAGTGLAELLGGIHDSERGGREGILGGLLLGRQGDADRGRIAAGDLADGRGLHAPLRRIRASNISLTVFMNPKTSTQTANTFRAASRMMTRP